MLDLLGDNTITVYAVGASGNATSTATIAGGNTGLFNRWASPWMANIYVANENAKSITVYAAGANGNPTPMVTIAGGNTGLNGPLGVTF